MKKPDQETKRLLDYRMQSVDVGLRALEYTMQWGSVQEMEIYFNGKLYIKGNSLAFTNPAVETAIIHCRALLEFLGLSAVSESKLGNRNGKRQDDVAIEDFSNNDGPLSKVTTSKAVQTHPGPAEEAEHALAYVLHTANKGLAHNTSSFSKHDDANVLLEIAFRGVKALMTNHFYDPMGLKLPEPIVTSQQRGSK